MKYVTYFRVSTAKQGRSGLGIEAQQEAVKNYLSGVKGEVLAKFTEVESGAKNDRVELEKALKRCTLTGATLVIAKLDRLSRDPEFLARMQKSPIKFDCCDMPGANNLTIGMMSQLASYERELISDRTKAAMQAAKKSGRVFGNPNLAKVRNTDTTAARAAKTKKANEYKSWMLEVINAMESELGWKLSSRVLAETLNCAGYQTSRGRKWTSTAVLRVKKFRAA